MAVAIALSEITSGLSCASPFELLIVAMADSELRKLQVNGERTDLDAVTERVRHQMRQSPPWSAELWDASFDAAFNETISAWRGWRKRERRSRPGKS